MDQHLVREAARSFGKAADQLVDACRLLEQYGMDDQPVERLLQALEEVTHQVHRMHPPEERVQFEPADLAVPPCRVAAQEEAAEAQGSPR